MSGIKMGHQSTPKNKPLSIDKNDSSSKELLLTKHITSQNMNPITRYVTITLNYRLF